MKIQSFLVRASLSFLLAFLTFSGVRLAAQTQADNASGAQAAPAVPARITQAIDDTQLVTLKGNVQLQARPEFDKGPVSDAQPMKRMMLLLRRSPEQQAALTQLMAGQLSKESPNFHKWLTPVQFGQQFGPADADIQTVTDWLTRQGFQGIKPANGRTVIEFSGTVAQVRNTFHTEIHNFVVDGKTYSANVSDPQIPVALSPVVAGIVSLHNFPRKSFRHDAGIHTVTRDSHGTPQFTTATGCGTGATPQCFFVGPADFAKIYNVPAALDGTGVTIGIVGDSNIDPNDAVHFRTVFGLSPTTGPAIIVDGPDPGISGPQGDEGEGDLDVQISGMVAPKAAIDFVVAEGTLTALGTDIATLRLVDDNLADVISESFGSCELALNNNNTIGFYQSVWEQAAAQGTSVMVSAGDNGSAACDDFHTEAVATGGLAVNGVASTIFNVAVGGTDFDDFTTQTNFWNLTNAAGTLESAKGYIIERTWNDSCAATTTAGTLNTVCANPTNITAGSGGPSGGPDHNVIAVPKPAYQTALTPADGVRDLPDVSLFASNGPQSHSFYPVCEADAAPGQPVCTGNQFVIGGAGGTSASSPAFAGIMALINQKLGGRQGNANVVLYQLAANAVNAASSCNSSAQALAGSATCAFYDITVGNNSVPCQGNTADCSSPAAGTNGVLVDPANPTTPAWTAKTGYDFATGLGSVNVTNLAAQWATAVGAFKGTTTGLTLNGGTTTVTTTHGTPVNVVGTVSVNAPNSGTPTGDVSLLGGAAGNINSGTDFNTLNGGSPDTVSFATSFLPGGSYNVKLHYTGDGTFAPSDSNAIPVVVNKENSRLQYEIAIFDTTGNFITSSPTTYAFGTLGLLRFDILNSSTGLCQIFAPPSPPAPPPDFTGCAVDSTGTVTITDNGASLDGGTFHVNAQGNLEDRNLQLSLGAHTLSATYSGDVSYNPVATPVIVMTTVTKGPTTAAVVANPTTVATGAQVALSATVTTSSFNAAGPTGTVTFFNGGTAIGSPVNVASSGGSQTNFILAGATATLNTTFSTAGTKSITATYNGDTNYSASAASPAATVTVNAATGSFTVASTAVTLSSATGASQNSTITVTSSGGFNSAVTVVCPTTLPPGMTCTAPAAITPPANGTATGTLALSVTATSTTLSAANTRQDQMLEAKTTPSGGKGWWTLSAGTGFAALFLLFLPGGRKRYRTALGFGLVCMLGLTMGCSGTPKGNTGPVATVTKLTVPSAKVASPTAFTFSVAVTGGTPGGMVQLFDGATMIGTAATVTGGTATPTAPALTVGTHAITAHYLGDANTKASQSGAINMTVTGSTTVAITTNPVATPAAPAIMVTIN